MRRVYTPVTPDSCERCVWVVSLAVAVPAFGSMTLSLSQEAPEDRGGWRFGRFVGIAQAVCDISREQSGNYHF